ncbi:Cytidylate kinase [Planctomycetes bacterium Poly30]|uniref:Cytidylate kinase n=1 Tax=Saltatorellus ferox TaxID=2528018 RepID=A0A518EU14_9BACT|nr:Cytidylate kinase [Planctomycetes bacterium Poly30]
MIIAIDGPAASGKSTAARALAKRLGLTFLDTGAMYRAVTLVIIDRGIDPNDEFSCQTVANSIRLEFDEEGKILIGGMPGEPAIRGPEVTRHVSEVSAHSGVRRALVRLQRKIADESVAAGGGVVAEGRDTTSVVFPTADLKVFLVASPRVRAERRATEEGAPERAAEYEKDLQRRDDFDSSREDSPLTETRDAVRVDTDRLSPDEVLEELCELARVRAEARD